MGPDPVDRMRSARIGRMIVYVLLAVVGVLVGYAAYLISLTRPT